MTDENTIKDAKWFLRNNWVAGTKCPCCSQNVKLTPTKIDPPMAMWLKALVDEYERTNDWVDLKTMEKLVKQRNGNYAKLRHWKLIESNKVNTDVKKRRSGQWKPTDTGIAFVNMQLSVPERVFLYNSTAYKCSEQFVNFTDCAKSEFDFRELYEDEISYGN